MMYIVSLAVIGVLLLNVTGAIPLSSVGGAMTVALATFIAVLAVAVHEAWTARRGWLGWIVNIVVSFVAAFFAAQAAGMAMVVLLLPFVDGTSLAAASEPVPSLALAGGMTLTLLGVWAALKVLNRFR